jgi:molybdopterin-guanine dinucleotide biosynthesis protein A
LTVRGAVLAGGASSRFEHRPKGLETVGGRRLLDRVVDALRDATGALPLLIANDPHAAEWRLGLEVMADLVPGTASLGGIYTAVCAGAEPVLVVAWDMPLLTAGLLRALAAGAGGYDVFVPESRGPLGVEPLCAVYGAACAEPIRHCLDRRILHATAFHDMVRVGRMPLADVAEHGVPEELFFNVNDRADLETARALWRAREPR